MIALYRHEPAGIVRAAIVVFPSPERLSRLDVYVVADDCTDETDAKGQLLAFQQGIPRTPDDDGSWRMNQNAQAQI
jgi:hypothetical protein